MRVRDDDVREPGGCRQNRVDMPGHRGTRVEHDARTFPQQISVGAGAGQRPAVGRHQALHARRDAGDDACL